MTLQMADYVEVEDEMFFTRTFPPLPKNALVRFPSLPRPRASCLWRGYVASWLVRGGRLFLTDLDGGPTLFARGPVFAYWVDMILVLPLGQVRRDLGHPYEPVWEADLELRIEAGVVTGWRLVRNPCRRRPAWQPGFLWAEVRRKLSDENLHP